MPLLGPLRSLGAAALCAACMGAQADGGAGGDAAAGGQIRGVLTDEGVMCPAMRGEDGALYTFQGLPEELGTGSRIAVEPAAPPGGDSSCDQGLLLRWARITLIDATGAVLRTWRRED